jgi:hypothetical protein
MGPVQTAQSKSVTRRIENFFNFHKKKDEDQPNEPGCSGEDTKSSRQQHRRTVTAGFEAQTMWAKKTLPRKTIPPRQKLEKSNEMDIIEMYRKKPDSGPAKNSPQ